MIVLCIVVDFVIFLRILMIFCLSDRRFLRIPSTDLNIFKMIVCDIKIIGSCLVDHIICARNVFNRILTE